MQSIIRLVKRSSLYLILLVSCLVIFITLLNFLPYEEEDIEIASYVQELYPNVDPGGSVNASVFIRNNGNTDVDVRLRFNHEYKWNLAPDAKISPYLDRPSEGIVSISADPSGNSTTRIDFIHTAPGSAEIGHRWLFIVDVIHIDEDLVQHMETHNFIITVGWVLPRGIPEEHSVVTGYVSHIDFNYTNLVIDPMNEPTRFYLDYEMPEDIEYTVTTDDITDMTAERIPDVDPIQSVDLTNRETSNLTMWIFCPPETQLADGLNAEFLVSITTNSVPIHRESVAIDIVPPVHNITIWPDFYYLRLDIGVSRAILFSIDSYSNVQERLAIEYLYDEVNITMVESMDEETIEPGDWISLRLVVVAEAEEDFETELTVIIRFGQDQEFQTQCTVTLYLEA